MTMLHNEKCCGCGACAAACPAGALSVGSDINGAYRPFADVKKCCGCGQCIRVCPCINSVFPLKDETEQEYYSVYASKDICMKSASGGAFRKIAEYVSANGGIVYGAGYNISSHDVSHREAGTDELDGICGSKYLQSYISSDIYISAGKYLENGRMVFFSGTPCQVAGLRNFLGKEYSGLLTADIICHGVSPVLYWKKFLSENTIPENISSVCFRHKADQKSAAEGYRLRIEFRDGSSYEMPAEKCPYYMAYFSGISINEACSRCKYASLERTGDITLGDYLPLDKSEIEALNAKGNSLVIINTGKGRKLFENAVMSDRTLTVRQVDMRNSVIMNHSLYKPAPEAAGAVDFRKDMRNMPFERAVRRNIAKRYDVLMFAPFYSGKAENIFRSLAVYSLLHDMGLKIAMTELPLYIHSEKPEYHYKKNAIQGLVYSHCPVLPPVYGRELCIKLSHSARMFILADEPLWEYSAEDVRHLFSHADDAVPRIALGLRISERLADCDDELRESFYDYLYQFERIFLSDEDVKEELEEVLEMETDCIPELLFLAPPEYYYSLSANDGEAIKTDVSYVWEKELYSDVYDCLDRIRSSETVVTDSYFAAVLCMLDGKNFFVTADAPERETLACLLERYGLEERILKNSSIPCITGKSVSAAADKIAESRSILLGSIKKAVMGCLE
ncbi:MAG: Coenzyme F420 hydrogenase/dehydrogenase, beta subunit C-terminal domain [Ruminococcus sp.]|nr:Coenzyme F420 hydrogenase/dehydrogenase, beta subunit C-terminal domain [Ruminococcus sp.]